MQARPLMTSVSLRRMKSKTLPAEVHRETMRRKIFARQVARQQVQHRDGYHKLPRRGALKPGRSGKRDDDVRESFLLHPRHLQSRRLFSPSTLPSWPQASGTPRPSCGIHGCRAVGVWRRLKPHLPHASASDADLPTQRRVFCFVVLSPESHFGALHVEAPVA